MNKEENEKNSVGNQLKEARDETIKKKFSIKKMIPKIMLFLFPIIIGVMVASCLISLVNIIHETAQNVINAIMDFFKGPQTAIEISDEQLDQIIEIIEATGIDIEDLELLR